MEQVNCMAALFDFDGVVMDTEKQYTLFWNEVGKRFFPDEGDFGPKIKGQTLAQIYQKYFPGRDDEQRAITEGLNRFEENMSYQYVPGVVRFMRDLRAHGVKMAIVTSSNALKMSKVYASHPELEGMVDRILTAELFTRSKPAPDCFLLGAEVFGTNPSRCVVFEDSFHGLEAGNAAGMAVVGLSTTNPEESIRDKCRLVIPDFESFSYEKMKELLV